QDDRRERALPDRRCADRGQGRHLDGGRADGRAAGQAAGGACGAQLHGRLISRTAWPPRRWRGRGRSPPEP
ncbi:hypothetical protein QU38_02165, partial [Staphylococcus aureus]